MMGLVRSALQTNCVSFMKAGEHREQRNISVVVDNDSWVLPYAKELVGLIVKKGDRASLCRSVEEVTEGYAAFYLGCLNIVGQKILNINQYNLVVHESDLPKGRGFAPVAWQVLEGKNDITMCLIEAAEEVDAGNIFLKKKMSLKGTELNNEIRDYQGKMSIELCLDFLDLEGAIDGEKQKGTATYYKRRRPDDSELDINKTIAQQFNLLRIADNEAYPAFFIINGIKYILHIEKSC